MPVNPVCPKARGDRRVPQEDVGSIVSQPSARELPGMLALARDERLERLTPERAAAAVEDLQQVTRVVADRCGGPEETGVSGDAAQRMRVLVVNFAGQQPAAPGIVFGGRRSRAPAFRWIELNLLHDAHLSEHRVEPALERHVSVEDEAEEHEPQVAVDRLRTRCILERSAGDRPLERVAAAELAEKRHPRRQTRSVRQQITNGDRVAIAAAPRGEVPANRVVEAHGAALDLLHHERRRREHLRQRGEIEDRVLRRPQSVAIVGERAEGLAPEQPRPVADLDHGGGKSPLRDGGLQDFARARERIQLPTPTPDSCANSQIRAS